jgi:hypothetical protein
VTDEGKRTEVVSFKATERMALDLLRLASADDRSMSDFLFRLMHRELYGAIGRLESAGSQVETSTK